MRVVSFDTGKTLSHTTHSFPPLTMMRASSLWLSTYWTLICLLCLFASSTRAQTPDAECAQPPGVDESGCTYVGEGTNEHTRIHTNTHAHTHARTLARTHVCTHTLSLFSLRPSLLNCALSLFVPPSLFPQHALFVPFNAHLTNTQHTMDTNTL